ncbi:MAG TPA: hypothetical protein VMT64_04945 [Candidatus Binataceae bacterium]|nr:hypothetical protein [Candidatus Binataceae bacterium]
MEPDSLPSRRLAGELLALAYIAVVATIAAISGAVYVMFPELGALSHDVMTRPRGSWARAPILLIVTPVATAAIGTLVTRHLPYGYLSVMLTVGGALIVLLALRSPIAPAISAGFLPLVLGVKSWWYPPAIVLSTAMLAALSYMWRRQIGVSESHPDRSAYEVSAGEESLVQIAALMLFVLAGVLVVKLTNLRFVLFPPLVVIAFEMFVHTAHCPWAARAMRLPIVCLLSASGGLVARHLGGVGPLSAIASMIWGVLMLRVFDLHVPPALAVALLPQVMEAPTILYPLSVGVGTSLLSGVFVLYQQLCETRLKPVDSSSAARKQV